MIELEFEDTIFGERGPIDSWNISLDSKRVGILQISAPRNQRNLFIEDITVSPHQLGIGGVRQLRMLIKQEYPQAETLTGFRVSGMRFPPGREFPRSSSETEITMKI